MGEAAHAIDPEAGVGAGLGFGDALALAVAIAGAADADAACRDYEFWRRPVVAPYEAIGAAGARMVRGGAPPRRSAPWRTRPPSDRRALVAEDARRRAPPLRSGVCGAERTDAGSVMRASCGGGTGYPRPDGRGTGRCTSTRGRCSGSLEGLGSVDSEGVPLEAALERVMEAARGLSSVSGVGLMLVDDGGSLRYVLGSDPAAPGARAGPGGPGRGAVRGRLRARRSPCGPTM